jgi:hypothetical protein
MAARSTTSTKAEYDQFVRWLVHPFVWRSLLAGSLQINTHKTEHGLSQPQHHCQKPTSNLCFHINKIKERIKL